MLKNNARNNITEVTKASQFGLNKSIQGLLVVGVNSPLMAFKGVDDLEQIVGEKGLTKELTKQLTTICEKNMKSAIYS